MFNIVIVIPVFQHGETLHNTILRILPSGYPVIAVNDGSDAMHTRLIRDACQSEQVYLVERKSNGGKGAAVIDGLVVAQGQGYTHAFQVDSDNQHDLSRMSEFIRLSIENPEALILGYPLFNDSVPRIRKFGRWLTHVFVWINTLSFRVRDSMCGFRIYPIAPVLNIIDASGIGHRMDFDTEITVRACWKNLPVINLPVAVVYPESGTSNFRIKEDNILLILMHTRLFFGMIFRLPLLVFSRIVKFGFAIQNKR